MRNLSSYLGQEGPLTISGGLGYAIHFAEALGPELAKIGLCVTVTGIRDGLFFLDEIRGLALRITMNSTAGCGRMYAGVSDDFEFATKLPQDSLTPFDWEGYDLGTAVEKAVAFLASGSLQNIRKL